MSNVEKQLRGMFLEEVILWLLKGSGYVPYDQDQRAEDDPTFKLLRGEWRLKGRGSSHQIDAIGDYPDYPPFGNPNRLLVEAKMYSKNKIGIGTIRNAKGVLCDVDEYWVGEDHLKRGRPARYHYQYAVFSTTGFSEPAQEYAYAHDIFLLPLNEQGMLAPVIEAIRGAAESLNQDLQETQGSERTKASLRSYRLRLRKMMLDEVEPAQGIGSASLNRIAGACDRLGRCYLGSLQNQMPIFLVPTEHTDQLIGDYAYQPLGVRIYHDEGTWRIRVQGDEALELFTFELPRELFKLYATGGSFDRENVFRVKADTMSEITVFKSQNGITGRIKLRLDPEWLMLVGETLNHD